MKHKKIWYTCDYCGKEQSISFTCYDNEFKDRYVTDICSKECLEKHLEKVRERILKDEELRKDLVHLMDIDINDIDKLVDRYKELFITDWEKLN